MKKMQFERFGVAGVCGGGLFLLFAFLHMGAHGFGLADHGIMTQVSQADPNFLGLLFYPLQVYALLGTVGVLKTGAGASARTLLFLAVLGLGMTAVGHGLLSVPYTGDWRTAPTEQVGWALFWTGNLTFASGLLLGALTAQGGDDRLRKHAGLLGGAVLATFMLEMLNVNVGLASTLVPALATGLAWIWLGTTFLRAARQPALVAQVTALPVE